MYPTGDFIKPVVADKWQFTPSACWIIEFLKKRIWRQPRRLSFREGLCVGNFDISSQLDKWSADGIITINVPKLRDDFRRRCLLLESCLVNQLFATWFHHSSLEKCVWKRGRFGWFLPDFLNLCKRLQLIIRISEYFSKIL